MRFFAIAFTLFGLTSALDEPVDKFDIDKIRAAREEMRELQKQYAVYRRERNIAAAESIQQQIEQKMEYIEAISLLAPSQVSARDFDESDEKGRSRKGRKGSGPRGGRGGKSRFEKDFSGGHSIDSAEDLEEFEKSQVGDKGRDGWRDRKRDMGRPRDIPMDLGPTPDEELGINHEPIEPGQMSDEEREKVMAERLKENLKRRKADYVRRIDRIRDRLGESDAAELTKDVDELFALEDSLHESRLKLTKYFDEIRDITDLDKRAEHMDKMRQEREASRERDMQSRQEIRDKRMAIEEKIRSAVRMDHPGRNGDL